MMTAGLLTIIALNVLILAVGLCCLYMLRKR